MEKAFIFILFIAGLVWSCKENNDVTPVQDQVSVIGNSQFFKNKNVPVIERNFPKISTLLNQLVQSEEDPKNLIKTAFIIKTNRLFGDTLSVIAANFLFQKATNIIEEFSFNSDIIKGLEYRRTANELQRQGIPVDIPLSNFRKVMINIQQKNFHYLFSRLQLQVKLSIAKTLANHKVLFAVSAILVAALIGFQIKMRRYFYSIILTLICAGVLTFYGMVPKSTGIPEYKLQGAMFDFKIEKEIGADQILNKQHIPIGNLMYINENTVGFSYHFSPLNLSPVIDSIAKRNQLLLNTTVSFVNNKMEPVGFTSVNGNLLNPMFNCHWDGLILVTDEKIEVLPLQQAKGISPTNNFENYFQLTQHIKKDRSDAFQIPLLVYNDSLLLKPENVSFRLRENRFFMRVVTPEKKGMYLIANIDNFYPLAYNTLAILNRLKADKYSVQFMALLDVGANNFFQVYNPDGKINRHYISTLPKEKATNILSFFLLQKPTVLIEL
jgi:hypothetical protein